MNDPNVDAYDRHIDQQEQIEIEEQVGILLPIAAQILAGIVAASPNIGARKLIWYDLERMANDAATLAAYLPAAVRRVVNDPPVHSDAG